VLAKDEAQRERLDQVLATLAHGVGTLAVLYSPVMPKATSKLWAALGESGSLLEQRLDRAWDRPGGGTVSALEPLFPRIEAAPA
jgi:methionyl-tRNA synthetase